jgi:hypothetical protein
MEVSSNYTSMPYVLHMHKPTSVKNPTANAMLERIYAVFTNMLCTAKLDMA